MCRCDNSHHTVITNEKLFDEAWWKLNIHHTSGMLWIAFSGRAQYQWHENILKVQPCSSEISKLMRYSLRVWWEISPALIEFSRFVSLKYWQQQMIKWVNKNLSFWRHNSKNEIGTSDSFAPSIEENDNQRTTKAHRPFALLPKPKKIPS